MGGSMAGLPAAALPPVDGDDDAVETGSADVMPETGTVPMAVAPLDEVAAGGDAALFFES
jgi:hypothetical protein